MPESMVKLVASAIIGDGRKVLLVKYHQPPEEKMGWWVPAAELAYGEHPDAACSRLLGSLGFKDAAATIIDLESLVTSGWTMLFHYRATTDENPKPGPEYRDARWFELDDLPPADQFARGSWERGLVGRLGRD